MKTGLVHVKYRFIAQYFPLFRFVHISSSGADVGQVLSFRGDLLHGGDPLLGGTRYIIAAFMLIHEEEDAVCDSEGSRVNELSRQLGSDKAAIQPSIKCKSLKTFFSKAKEESGEDSPAQPGFSFSFGCF